MSSFKNLRIVDNFYQTSAFFPMPTILISTLTEDGETSLGAYSLCFPYYIAGKSYYAMVLECRNSSNTCQNILKTGKCALNFLEDDLKLFIETVRLGFPGETSKEKMENTFLKFEEGIAEGKRPKVLSDAFQVFECTWDSELENAFEDKLRVNQLEGINPPYRNFNGITSKYGAHFILKIDKILMKEKFHNSIVYGVKKTNFPKIPVDYGYRDSTHFWYSKFKKPIGIKIPEKPVLDLSSVKYAASRIDPEYEFSDKACEKLIKIPRIFLKVALSGIISEAKNLELEKQDGKYIIDVDTLDYINDKRKTEKQ